MHRTMSTFRKWSLGALAGLALHTAAPRGAAQPPPEPLIQAPKDAPPAPAGQPILPPPAGQVAPAEGKDGAKVIVAVVNITKTIGMTKRPGAADEPIIEKVQVENPRVVRVQSIFNDPRHVLVTGLAPGTSRVTFSGYTDPAMKDRREEVFEIRVISDEAMVRQKLRDDFLALVRKTAPTANIDAIIVAQTTRGVESYTTQSIGDPNAQTTTITDRPPPGTVSGQMQSSWVVFLTGNVLTSEDVNTVLETARASFGGNANIVNNMTVGGVQQVEVDCVICSVNRSKLRTMSFSWALNRPDFYINSVLSANSLTNTIATAPAAVIANQSVTGGSNIAFGAITDAGSFFGFLQALRTDGLAKIQAEPKVVTLSGRPAQVVSGGETPILTQSGIGGPNVTYRTFGVTVTVLPIVLGNGKIHLEVAPLISQLNQAAGITIAGATGSTVVPGFDTQGAQVAIQLEDGQTVAIGGLIQHTVNATNSKVPVLGDIPFLGAAFRSVSYNEREAELIILVTPRLIDPMSCDQLPARLPTRLTRSPDDFELYLEGLLELPRGQRQTCGPNGCYQAPHNIGPTANLFPCGDQGSCGVTGAGAMFRGHRGACGPNGCVVNAHGSTVGGCVTTTGAAAPAPGNPLAVPTIVPDNAPANPIPAPAAMPIGQPISEAPRPTFDSGFNPPMSVAPVSHTGPAAGPALRLPASNSPE